MATQQTSAPAAAKTVTPEVRRATRRRLRREGKKALAKKLATDKEFHKTYFEAKSKRSNDKKAAFRKKKSKKK